MLNSLPSKQHQKEVLDIMSVKDIFEYLASHRLEDAALFGLLKTNRRSIDLDAICHVKANSLNLPRYLKVIEKTFEHAQ